MRTRAVAATTDHPAMRKALGVVRAVAPGFDPAACESLMHGKSDVFLVQSASGHPPLVAKCANEDTISIEIRVLTWLEAAPFPTVRAHGSTKAHKLGRAWLVSEYAVGEPFHRHWPIHRRLVGAWMGDLHVWSTSVATPTLPARDSAYHRRIVREACATLADTLDAAVALTAHDNSTVRALEEMGSHVLDRWSDVHALLSTLPTTLVHSDIAGKNLRVVADSGRTAVLAFDWEQAGWGCPAADMSMVDLQSYAVPARAGGIDLPKAPLVMAVGELLWCFAGIPGERPNLLGSWPHRAVAKLAAYLDRIRAAMLVLDANTRW